MGALCGKGERAGKGLGKSTPQIIAYQRTLNSADTNPVLEMQMNPGNIELKGHAEKHARHQWELLESHEELYPGWRKVLWEP